MPQAPRWGDVVMRPEPALHRSTLRASYGCYATGLGSWVSDSVPERAFYLGSPLISNIMALEYIAPSCCGADSLGLSAVADNTLWGGIG